MTPDNRVLIAGAGPVGMISGYYLARQGIPVTVFDSLPETTTDHRASTVHPSTLEMLSELDMTDEMAAKGLVSAVFQFRDRYDDRVVAEFDYGIIADETPFPYALQVEQHKVINIAREHAEKLPDFTLMRPYEAVGLKQDDDGVELSVKNPDGEIETHTGRYLIAADGGRSIIRKALDIDFPGFTWGERFVIATTKFDFGAPDAGNHRYRNYVAHPDQWCALIKVAGDDMSGLWRILLPASGDEPDEYVKSLDWVKDKYAECLPYSTNYEIIHRNLYNVHQRVAETFHVGRTVLAGDSAHVNNPLGGMGMNGGIHDGLNIAEKLVRIWRGEGDDALLAQYDRQRRTMAKKYVQAQSIQNKELLQESDMDIRRQKLDALGAITDDHDTCHEYLLKSSLIAMVREANSVQ
ncbi:MAG: FAD-binding monooxygenase [Alphaproteobacteria bacterium]|nr:FAD-binding monooxygenase [Alphaproteobacteria bacterium]